jgi:general secretion pathway protein G
MNKRRNSRRRGFTIAEIIVVVIIIGVLGAMIAPKLFSKIGQAKHSVAVQQMGELEKAVDLFCTDYERFPADLDELVDRPSDIPEEKWNPPTIKAKNLIDPWGRTWEYRVPSEHGGYYDLFSLGRDGAAGGEKDDADIVSW